MSTTTETATPQSAEQLKWQCHFFVLVVAFGIYLYCAAEVADLKAAINAVKASLTESEFADGVGTFVARMAAILAIPFAAYSSSRSTFLGAFLCIGLGVALVPLGLYWHAGAAFGLAALCAAICWISAVNSLN